MCNLGERAKTVIRSVTEGDDKPLNDPYMFEAAEMTIINEIDLLPQLDSDLDAATDNAVNPAITTLRVSARTGEGLEAWCEWLHYLAAEARL